MAERTDVTLTLPMEHFPVLSAVIHAGLKHAKIKPDTRRELEAWWRAESDLIQSEIELGESGE